MDRETLQAVREMGEWFHAEARRTSSSARSDRMHGFASLCYGIIALAAQPRVHQPSCDLADWDGRSNDPKPSCTCKPASPAPTPGVCGYHWRSISFQRDHECTLGAGHEDDHLDERHDPPARLRVITVPAPTPGVETETDMLVTNPYYCGAGCTSPRTCDATRRCERYHAKRTPVDSRA